MTAQPENAQTRSQLLSATDSAHSGESTMGPGGTAPSKLWLGPPKLAVVLTHCGQLILRKISKFDANRCQIFKAKMHKVNFRWGSAPDPAGVLTMRPRPSRCI